jgi:hypothetical protein
MQKNSKSEGNIEELLKLREAPLQLGISFPTIKQWIYKKNIRSNRTREDIIVSRRANWTDCFSEPVARLSNNAKKKSGA